MFNEHDHLTSQHKITFFLSKELTMSFCENYNHKITLDPRIDILLKSIVKVT